MTPYDIPRAQPTSGTIPSGGLVQLFASVVPLSSVLPLTKIALTGGATPLWFAEDRAILPGLTAYVLLAVTRGVRLPACPDPAAILAIGGLQLGTCFAVTPEAVAWVPAGRTAILVNTTTIWVVSLSLIFLRESFTPDLLAGAALIMAGVVLAAWPRRRHQ